MDTTLLLQPDPYDMQQLCLIQGRNLIDIYDANQTQAEKKKVRKTGTKSEVVTHPAECSFFAHCRKQRNLRRAQPLLCNVVNTSSSTSRIGAVEDSEPQRKKCMGSTWSTMKRHVKKPRKTLVRRDLSQFKVFLHWANRGGSAVVSGREAPLLHGRLAFDGIFVIIVTRHELELAARMVQGTWGN
ncbi:hypothetical protein BDQ17DRAFT_1407670 [Cyathus striatus]|nr:hypothetical protein BDQ17DRAFT_1407670 [Cyathus striatus]